MFRVPEGFYWKASRPKYLSQSAPRSRQRASITSGIYCAPADQRERRVCLCNRASCDRHRGIWMKCGEIRGVLVAGNLSHGSFQGPFSRSFTSIKPLDNVEHTSGVSGTIYLHTSSPVTWSIQVDFRSPKSTICSLPQAASLSCFRTSCSQSWYGQAINSFIDAPIIIARKPPLVS
jgi:hypothetical protein